LKNKLIIMLFVVLFLLSACKSQGKIYKDEDIDDFDRILNYIGNGNTKAYDLRSYNDCVAGRIPGFFCMRTIRSGKVRSLEEIASDLMILLGDKYNFRIILIDYNGEDARHFTELMNNSGYYNIHYFAGGYNRYVELKGNDFVPEIGECNGC